jgi:hypothetical protein
MSFKMKYLFLTIFIINFLLPTRAQKLAETEHDLSLLGWEMNKNPDDEIRLKSAYEFHKLFKETLGQEGTFTHRFDSLQMISFLYPADSSFRVITWQLFANKNQYEHYGFIQTANGKLFDLADRSDAIIYPDRKELGTNEWYGAVYYNMKEYKTKEGKPIYVLFGYDGYGLYMRSKVLDVLTFKDGTPIFGKEIFEVKKVTPPRSKREKASVSSSLRMRLIFEYSAESSMSLNFNPDINAIMFDHLQAVQGQYQGQGNTFLPDGTYEALEWNGKTFDHVLEVPIQALDKPLSDERPEPKTKKKRGLFGEERK